MFERHSFLVGTARIVECVDLGAFIDLFPEVSGTSFFPEFLDWMDVSSGDAALTLVKMEDFRFSMKDYLEEVARNASEYDEGWGEDVTHFVLYSDESPLATLNRMDDDLYINLED